MRKLKNEELERLSVEDFKKTPKKPVIVVLDNIRSLNNIGSVFRTADAFLTEKIYLCGITAQPPHRDIQKTALGATESVEWQHEKDIVNALQELKQQGYIICAIEQCEESIPLNRFFPEKDKKYALIFGNEVGGVSDQAIELSDMAIEIPQKGTKHSLNIAVSAGVVLWDFFSKS